MMKEAMQQEFNHHREQLRSLLGATEVSLNACGTDFSIIADGKRVAAFSMDSLYGCSGLCVFYHSVIAESYRGRGLGKLLHTMRLNVARACHFGMVQCTVRADNDRQKKILERNGWQQVGHFHNPKTGNEVLVWTRNL